MKTKKVIVKDVIGPYGGTYEDGAKLYRVISGLLKDAQHVELDFDGIELASSSFFYGAIGPLLQQCDGRAGPLPLSYLNVSPRDTFVLDHTLKAAKRVDEVGVEF